MQHHHFTFEVDASPQAVWDVFHGPRPRVVEYGDVRIEILHAGDERGEGLVRHCHFAVPRYLLSGGRARSWEWLTQLDPPHSWRYDAIGKPLWSEATGVTELEALDEGRTRVHFSETYHVFNPIMRVLLERRVHAFISSDNDTLMKAGVEAGLRARRREHK
ncbi:MAG: SRPBCC family protein [Acidimicrobiales bacterium]